MNTWKKTLRISFGLLFFIAFLSSSVYSQRVDTYQVVNFTATWTPITATGTNFSLNSGSNTAIALPFDFPYDGSTIPSGSMIQVSGYGSIGLTSTLPPTDQTVAPTAEGNPLYPGLLCIFSSYMNDNGTGYWQVDGTAPNRVFTIEDEATWFVGSGGFNEIQWQVKLYETSGNIEFIYGTHNNNFQRNTTQTACIGLNGLSTPSFVFNQYAAGQTVSPATDIRWLGIPPGPPSQLSLSPHSIDFGRMMPGQRDTFCITARDVGIPDTLGPAALKILSYSLLGDADFSIIGVAPAANDTIFADSSKRYCIQFTAPAVLGPRSAIFSLYTDGKDSGAQSVTLRGAAVLPAVEYDVASLFHRTSVKLGDSATQYIRVTSSGGGPLTFHNISLSSVNPGNYYISHYPQNPLPFGTTDSIGVTFTPVIEGRPDASITITTDAINIPNITMQMFGVGILPRLVLTPSQGNASALIFDSTAMGDSVCRTISLTNIGSDTLHIRHQLEEGDPDFIFYPLIGSDTIILPNETKLVNVCFKPIQQGNRLATVRFYTNIPMTFEGTPRDTSQFSINISGIGVPAGRLVFSGPLPDSAEVGKHICVVDTVANIGTAPITITNVAITGPNASEFSLNGIPPLPFSFPVGLKAMNQICFSPQARGLRTANLLITVQAPGREITETIPLVGHGLLVCTSANPSPAVFGASGKTLVSTMDTTTVTVTNCGDVATTYTAATSPANYTIAGPATSASIAPNGTASFKVVFAPTTVGAYPGTAVFTGGTPDTVALNGIGAGVTATATGSAGSVGKGACQNFTVTIVNTGTLNWILNTATIGGANAADFTIVSGPTPDTLPPGDTAMLTIKFCPSIVGSETAALTFPSGSPSPIGGFSYALTGTGIVNGVSEKASDQGFELGQSYPNPTTGSAVVMFTLPTDAPVRIDLIDAKGNTVHTVFTGRMTSGDHTVTLDAKDLASGTYFYTLTSGDIHLTRQMILVR